MVNQLRLSILGLVSAVVLSVSSSQVSAFSIKSDPISLKGFVLKTESKTTLDVNGQSNVSEQLDETHYTFGKHPSGYVVHGETLYNKNMANGAEQTDPLSLLMKTANLSILLDRNGQAVDVLGIDEVYDAAIKQFGPDMFTRFGYTKEKAKSSQLKMWGNTYGLFIGNEFEVGDEYEYEYQQETMNGLIINMYAYLTIEGIEKAFGRDALRMKIEASGDEESFIKDVLKQLENRGEKDYHVDSNGISSNTDILVDLSNGLVYEFSTKFENGYTVKNGNDSMIIKATDTLRQKITNMD